MMRALLIVLFFIFSVFSKSSAASTYSANGYGISQNFSNFLENIRNLIHNGSSANNIPVLDPFYLKTTSFKFESKYLDFNLHSTEALLTGVGDFIFHDAGIMISSQPKVFYNFSLPFSVIKTDSYNFIGLLFKVLPIYGRGKSYFEVDNLQIVGSSDLKTDSKGYVEFLNFSFKVYLNGLKSETDGMLGGGDIDTVINEILADLGPDFILFYSDEISQIVTDMFLDEFNKLIYGVTLGDLANLLG